MPVEFKYIFPPRYILTGANTIGAWGALPSGALFNQVLGPIIAQPNGPTLIASAYGIDGVLRLLSSADYAQFSVSSYFFRPGVAANQTQNCPSFVGAVGSVLPNTCLQSAYTLIDAVWGLTTTIAYNYGAGLVATLELPVIINPGSQNVPHSNGPYDLLSNAAFAVAKAMAAAVGALDYTYITVFGGRPGMMAILNGSVLRSVIVVNKFATADHHDIPVVLNMQVDMSMSSLIASVVPSTTGPTVFGEAVTSDGIVGLVVSTDINGNTTGITPALLTVENLSHVNMLNPIDIDTTLLASNANFGDFIRVFPGDDPYHCYVVREIVTNDVNLNPLGFECKIWEVDMLSGTNTEIIDYGESILCFPPAVNAPQWNFGSPVMRKIADRIYSYSVVDCTGSLTSGYLTLGGDPHVTAISFAATKNFILGKKQLNFFRRLGLSWR